MAQTRVILFGVGGVGSWCAEALIRTGFLHLTLVDSDCVCASNINRQLMATHSTLNKKKVDVLKERLLDINPNAEIEARCERFTPDTVEDFHLSNYDIIIDAIDSLDCKAALILAATALPAEVQFYSSMGAALKLDISKIRMDEFWKVQGCPLARALRTRFKKTKCFPARKFQVVYSSETPLINATAERNKSAQPNGSLMHITATFGLYIVGEILKNIPKE